MTTIQEWIEEQYQEILKKQEEEKQEKQFKDMVRPMGCK